MTPEHPSFPSDFIRLEKRLQELAKRHSYVPFLGKCLKDSQLRTYFISHDKKNLFFKCVYFDRLNNFTRLFCIENNLKCSMGMTLKFQSKKGSSPRLHPVCIAIDWKPLEQQTPRTSTLAVGFVDEYDLLN